MAIARGLTNPASRYLDCGIEIRPARQNEAGIEALPGRPRLSAVPGLVVIGGIVDTVTRTIVGETESPIVWYCSEAQRPLILHEVEDNRSRILCYGAEGSGKTAVLCMHSIVQVLRNLGWSGFAGLTAPTGERLRTVVDTMRNFCPIDTPHQRRPGSWATYHGFGNTGEIRFKTGITIQCRSTHQQSEAIGSPIQGASWLWCDSDELQDTVEDPRRDADIEARLRVAPRGKSRRLCTATAKDSSSWRTFRDAKKRSKHWTIERMPYDANLVVWPEHWETMRSNMSAREWSRRGLALDVGPERAVYPAWSRETNLRPLPQIGAEDVTSHALRGMGPNLGILIGHDPGTLQDVSLMLRAYRLRGSAQYVWWVIDELTTTGTTEEHGSKLLARLRQKWGTLMADAYRPGLLDELSPRAHVRCDPQGNTDSKTDRSVYQSLRGFGFDVRSAAYSVNGKTAGRVPKDAGIEMVNRLLLSASGESRLFVDCDDSRQPVAPKLVEALEMSERDEAGRAETDKKDRRDLSHWPAALRYALWWTERRIDTANQRKANT